MPVHSYFGLCMKQAVADLCDATDIDVKSFRGLTTPGPQGR